MKSGDLDLLPYQSFTGYAMFGSPASVPAVEIAGQRISWFVLNQQSAVLSDVVVRRALRLGLNRAGILQRTFHGAGVLNESLLPPFAPEYDKDLAIVKYDPKAAAALLEADGWKLGSDGVRTKNGTRLHIQVVSGAGSALVDQVLEQARADWTAIGFEMETKLYDGGLFFAPISEGGIVDGGHFDLALWSPGAVFADSFPAQFDCSLIPPNGNNDFRYCNRHLQPILHQIERTYDPIALAPMYKQLQRTLDDDVPFIVIGSTNEYTVHTDDVTGLHIPPYYPFDDFMDVDVTR